jgi:hypothetical protein
MTTTQRVARKEKKINNPCALPAQAMSPPDTPCLPKQTKRQSLRDHWRNRMSALPDTHSGSRSGTHRCICEGERKESQCPASYTQSDLVKEKLTSCANTPFHARLRRHTDCISAILLSWKAPVFPPQWRLRRTRDPGGRPACIGCTPLCRRWDR